MKTPSSLHTVFHLLKFPTPIRSFSYLHRCLQLAGWGGTPGGQRVFSTFAMLKRRWQVCSLLSILVSMRGHRTSLFPSLLPRKHMELLLLGSPFSHLPLSSFISPAIEILSLSSFFLMLPSWLCAVPFISPLSES